MEREALLRALNGSQLSTADVLALMQRKEGRPDDPEGYAATADGAAPATQQAILEALLAGPRAIDRAMHADPRGFNSANPYEREAYDEDMLEGALAATGAASTGAAGVPPGAVGMIGSGGKVSEWLGKMFKGSARGVERAAEKKIREEMGELAELVADGRVTPQEAIARGRKLESELKAIRSGPPVERLEPQLPRGDGASRAPPPRVEPTLPKPGSLRDRLAAAGEPIKLPLPQPASSAAAPVPPPAGLPRQAPPPQAPSAPRSAGQPQSSLGNPAQPASAGGAAAVPVPKGMTPQPRVQPQNPGVDLASGLSPNYTQAHRDLSADIIDDMLAKSKGAGRMPQDGEVVSRLAEAYEKAGLPSVPFDELFERVNQAMTVYRQTAQMLGKHKSSPTNPQHNLATRRLMTGGTKLSVPGVVGAGAALTPEQEREAVMQQLMAP